MIKFNSKDSTTRDFLTRLGFQSDEIDSGHIEFEGDAIDHVTTTGPYQKATKDILATVSTFQFLGRKKKLSPKEAEWGMQMLDRYTPQQFDFVYNECSRGTQRNFLWQGGPWIAFNNPDYRSPETNRSCLDHALTDEGLSPSLFTGVYFFDNNVPENIKELGLSVVRIRSDLGAGSGVITGPNTILTAKHVLFSPTTQTLSPNTSIVLDGTCYPISEDNVTLFPGHDLVRVTLPNPPDTMETQAASLTGEGTININMDSQLVVIGYPGYLDSRPDGTRHIAINEGIRFYSFGGWTAPGETAAYVSPGMSGGAVFDVQSGQLIGIISRSSTFIENYYPHITQFVPAGRY